MPIGTRTRALSPQLHPAEASMTRSVTRDPGKSGNVVSTSPTFGSGRITGATNDFLVAAGFAVPNRVLIEGTQLNNGLFLITGIDGTNHAYLTLDPAPKAETPASARVIVW